VNRVRVLAGSDYWRLCGPVAPKVWRCQSEVSAVYRKNMNNWTVFYVVQNSVPRKEGKQHSRNAALSPSWDRNSFSLDLTERKAQRLSAPSIIQVFTVSLLAIPFQTL